MPRGDLVEQVSLMVVILTSDDVQFSAMLSESLSSNLDKKIYDMYDIAAAKLKNPPKLILAFGPRNSEAIHTTQLVEALTKAAGSCPVFGGLAIDFDTNYIDEEPKLIFNGQTFFDRTAVVLLDGDIDPKFSLMTIPFHKSINHRSIITKVINKNLIVEANGLPVLEYLSSFGLTFEQKKEMPFTLPIVVTSPEDNYSKPMFLVSQSDEGYLACTQDVPLNSTFSLIGFDESDVLNTTRELGDILKWENFKFCLILTCVARNLALGLDFQAEFTQIRRALGDLSPYIMLYTGGELCPDKDSKGHFKTRYYNLALVCCRF
jgi:hypothetical protein